jgi:2-polyprenyl-3-methyl-5-hydroxy-6-metoxy-1,4-benzoquinol methylase
MPNNPLGQPLDNAPVDSLNTQLNWDGDKVHYQYDQFPYPDKPVDQFPEDAYLLACCNLTTPYYLRNRRIAPLPQCQILDVGCGSGWTTLAVAAANPEAQVIGIDFSPQSIALAQQRCHYHNLEHRVHFHCLSLEEVDRLGMKFDMINCDEVLYLIPDPFFFLQTFQKILKPNGIIRGNFHSARQRHYYYSAQDFFKEINIFHETAGAEEIEMIKNIFNCLRDDVLIKAKTIDPHTELSGESVRMNFMIQGDRGFTIPQIFELLRGANLEFIQVLEWTTWRLDTLFKTYDDLPIFLAYGFNDLDPETHLHLYELLNPVHRLIDFWCGHPLDPDLAPDLAPDLNPDLDSCSKIAPGTHNLSPDLMLHFHPLLRRPQVYQTCLQAIANLQPFNLSGALPIIPNPLLLSPQIATVLLPLFGAPQSLQMLLDRYLQFYPIDPITDCPRTALDIQDLLIPTLLELEQFTYVLFD